MGRSIEGRCMFVWRLAPVVKSEMGVEHMVRKARAAGLGGVWIKVADGNRPYDNVKGPVRDTFLKVRDALRDAGIAVWGWQVPYGGDVARAREEARVAAELAVELDLDGVLMDAEGGSGYFEGGPAEAEAYAGTLKDRLSARGIGLAMCGNDIPKNFPGYAFNSFVKFADFNAPQVYYGSSPSVANRLNRAVDANRHVQAPFIPVGAAWVGDGGGNASASASAERAREFLRLVDQAGWQGCSFWHWMGAPAAFWEVLFDVPANDAPLPPDD